MAEVNIGRRQAQVITESGGKLYRYTFKRDGDTLYLDNREKASDPGAGTIPNWRNASNNVTGTVRNLLNSRGYSAKSSTADYNSGGIF